MEEIPCDLNLEAVFDEKRGVFWLGAAEGGELVRLELATGKRTRLPLVNAHVTLEPETGCVWAATADGVCRINERGEYLSGTAAEKPGARWVVLAAKGGGLP